jgi:hypothetical protein
MIWFMAIAMLGDCDVISTVDPSGGTKEDVAIGESMKPIESQASIIRIAPRSSEKFP